MSIKLSAIQLVLLRGAAQRDDHHLSLPRRTKLSQARNAAAMLLEARLVKEVKATKDAPVWRRDRDADQAYSLKLTATGLKAAAVDDCNSFEEAAPQVPSSDAMPNEAAHSASDATNAPSRVEPGCSATMPVSPRVGSKIAEVVAMLEGERGATLDQLVAATGWLPHTTRAALTGLRKRGYTLAADRLDRKRGSIYRIVAAPSTGAATDAAEATGGPVARNADPSGGGSNGEPARRKPRSRVMPSPAKARARRAA